MAKNLTDTPVFSDTVQAPIDGDLVTGLSVEVGEQALMNRTAFLHTAQLSNWGPDTNPSGGGPANTADAVTYDEGGLVWIVIGGAAAANSSPDDVSWTDIGPSGLLGGTPGWIASKAPADAPVHTGARSLAGNVATDVSEYDGVGWSSLTLPGSISIETYDAVFDAASSQWIIVGRDGAPALWYGGTPIALFTPVLPGGLNSTRIIRVASNPAGPLLVAAGDLSPFDTWTSTDGINWTLQAPLGVDPTEIVVGLQFDSVSGLFVLLTSRSCYTSPDGVIFSSVFGPRTSSVFSGRLTIGGGGRGFYVASELVGPILAFSRDRGQTWDKVEVAVGGPTTLAFAGTAYSAARGKYMASLRNTVALAGRVSTSLSAGLSQPIT